MYFFVLVIILTTCPSLDEKEYDEPPRPFLLHIFPSPSIISLLNQISSWSPGIQLHAPMITKAELYMNFCLRS